MTAAGLTALASLAESEEIRVYVREKGGLTLINDAIVRFLESVLPPSGHAADDDSDSDIFDGMGEDDRDFSDDGSRRSFVSDGEKHPSETIIDTEVRAPVCVGVRCEM